MRLKGKKVRSKAGGQKFFSWSKIRALGSQMAKNRAKAKTKGGGRSKKKGKKKKANIETPTATESCCIAMDVVARLRDEEHQCDVLVRCGGGWLLVVGGGWLVVVEIGLVVLIVDMSC